MQLSASNVLGDGLVPTSVGSLNELELRRKNKRIVRDDTKPVVGIFFELVSTVDP